MGLHGTRMIGGSFPLDSFWSVVVTVVNKVLLLDNQSFSYVRTDPVGLANELRWFRLYSPMHACMWALVKFQVLRTTCFQISRELRSSVWREIISLICKIRDHTLCCKDSANPYSSTKHRPQWNFSNQEN